MVMMRCRSSSPFRPPAPSRRGRLVGFLIPPILWLWLGVVPVALGQQPAPDPTAPPAAALGSQEGIGPEASGTTEPSGSIPVIGPETILKLIVEANPMLWPLFFCSIFTIGVVLERAFTLTRGRVLPRDFVQRFLERLATGKLDRERALEFCRAQSSPAARIFAIAVRHWGKPGWELRQIVASDAAAEIAELRRRTRTLSGLATLGPLLGLLGTVWGLIESFGNLGGKVGTAKGDALAHGISLALVATAIGLVIAVIAVTAHTYFQYRIDGLIRDLDARTRDVVDLIAGDSPRGGPGTGGLVGGSAHPGDPRV